MSVTPSDGPAGSDFMDDFYAECDEHFGEIRGALIHLESAIDQRVPDSTTLLRLFRSFHSLKGIFGMAGLQVAETLAHRTEDYLRSLTGHQTVFSGDGFDALTGATERLEQIVVAHRQGQPPPDISALLDEIQKRIESPRAGASAPNGLSPSNGVQERVQEAQRHGLTIWHCLFEPSQALSEQGKNVNSARARAEALGEILHSAPKIETGGKILFEFVVAGPADPGDAAEWKQEGIALQPYVAPLAPPPTRSAPQRVAESAAPAFVAPSHIVRVDLTRLDELMRIMGDMVVHRARLEEISTRISTHLPTAEARSLQEINAAFGRELRNLRDGLMRVRLVSIGEIFQRLPFVVRDLARETGKKIRLAVSGQETEIDKYLVERLKDPLLHLVRNAVCHGLETLEERIAAGKSPEATITLRASTIGESVVIEVADDGRGMDERAIVGRARASGISVTDHPDAIHLLELISRPGFSTRDEADRGAGRGVGMAAVMNTVNEMGGEIILRTDPGKGVTFTLRLPLTLAIADALIIAAGGQRFAMPQSLVQEITTAEPAAIKQLERNEVMPWRNGVLPLIRLASLFGLTAESRREFPVLVIGTGLSAVGIVADRLLGQREIVVRSVNDPLLKVPAIAGATELGDGRAVLILDSNGLIQSARQHKDRREMKGANYG
ncbi:MAG TPA: chemotaxis protein CheA [Candidatus Binatia bacterium]|nr:chemotaxis protein CheA [Candidatus Binatia bacterium]